MKILRARPATYLAITNAQGVADFSIKIPGTFGGPTGDGRHLKVVQVWSNSGAPGDRITGLRIADVDRVMAGGGLVPDVVMQQKIPSYPVLEPFNDLDIVEPLSGAGLYRGYGIPVGRVIDIEPIAPVRGFQFIPSGIHVVGTFVAGDAAEGRRFGMNFVWAKMVTPF